MNRLEQMKLLAEGYTSPNRLMELRQKAHNNNLMTHTPMAPMGAKGQAVLDYANNVLSGNIAKNGLLELAQVAEQSRANPQGLMDYFGPGSMIAKGAGLLGMVADTSRSSKIAALRAEANRQRFGEQDLSYRIEHTAPVREGRNTLDDMSDIYPSDIYDPSVSGRYYGHGDKELDNTTANIISKIKGNPDAEITIYRAVPKGVKVINPGDWITINPKYADFHGSSWVDDGSYDIISKKVKASEITTDGNSIHEYGYSPE